jgi:predicted peroxiredoxin
MATPDRSAPVEDLVRRGVHVWVDDFSISVRGFDQVARSPGIRLGGAPDLVRLLMIRDTVAIWH